MNLIDRAISWFAPQTGLNRMRARAALSVMMNYSAATTGNRSSSWKPVGSDADQAAARRARLAFVARDMIRNTPFATRAQAVIAASVVGTGIIPKVEGGPKGQQQELRDLIERHLDTTAIDADGLNNLYGLQRLAMNAIVDSGEVLIRRRLRDRRDRLPLALQLQVLEADFIDSGKDGETEGGGYIREGIEYDAIGRRVAYWLFPRHPGSAWRRGANTASRRVPASEILHIFRPDRPGQMRGVSWLAPVAMRLQDEDDHQDAQLMRQKIAACFAAFRVDLDGETDSDGDDIGSTLVPGRIQKLRPGEDIKFASPPAAEGYDEFTRAVLRSAAAGLGVTYESLTGDLSNVNFTSYKAGRIEMDRNVEAWQWLMLIPMMMQPIGRWVLEAWALERMGRPSPKLKLSWVPPVRQMIDPAREVGAKRDLVRGGFASRQGIIRELGYDPEKVLEEQIEDAQAADAAGLKFDSDARMATAGQPAVADSATTDATDDAAQDTKEEPDDGAE